MHNRMKEALVLLGKLPRAVVRPPLVKIERAEIERIRKALVEAGLLERQGRREGRRGVVDRSVFAGAGGEWDRDFAAFTFSVSARRPGVPSRAAAVA